MTTVPNAVAAMRSVAVLSVRRRILTRVSQPQPHRLLLLRKHSHISSTPSLTVQFESSFQNNNADHSHNNNNNHVRYFSDAAPDVAGAAETAVAAAATLSSPDLQKLYDTIVDLPEEDVNILGALIIQVLGRKIFPGEFGGGGAAMAGGDGSAAAGGDGEAVVEQAKTIFDLKLMGFDAKAKIKVIKEVRAIAGLGLKEAKDLVEAAPKVLQKDLKQERAEELKAQLEAVGATIELV